jgi:predicted nucleic acid-binding protein
MSVLVIDASVAVKWYLEEPLSDEASALLAAPHELHAPELLLLEADSVLRRRMRQRRIDIFHADQSRASLRLLPIRWHPIDRTLIDLSWDVTGRTAVSAFDGLYLALAELLNARVVTADLKLLESVKGGPLARNVAHLKDVR